MNLYNAFLDLVKQSDNACKYCMHAKCNEACRNRSDDLSCFNLPFGTCEKLRGTPCDGCVQNEWSGFEFKGDVL